MNNDTTVLSAFEIGRSPHVITDETKGGAVVIAIVQDGVARQMTKAEFNLWNPEGSSSLTATQVAFGSTLNAITSSSSFTYNTTSRVFNVAFAGGWQLQMDGANGFFLFGNTASAGGCLSIGSGICAMGDIGAFGNSMVVQVDDGNQIAGFYQGILTPVYYLKVDIANKLYALGNPAGTVITVDDTAHTINLSAANGIKINGTPNAADGTYASPTSITIKGGIITAIS